MKELVDLSTYRPQLAKIASKITDEAVYLIQYGFRNTKSPFITGNLRNRVQDYNTVNKMLAGFDNKPNQLTLEFVANPKDATYGYYIVTGTSTSRNYGRRDYGTLAMNEAEVKQKIRGLQKEIFQDTGEFLNEEFQNVFSDSVFKKQ
tara:strand:+ start:139 stop:579 length:441 start_codon:yes stop_codon:yes gene_type:complete